MWAQLQTYLGSGGFVMVPLLILAAILWYMLGYRICNLWLAPWRTRIERACASNDPLIGQYVLERALVQVEQSFMRGRTLIQTICIVAPLAGLLGTVSEHDRDL